LVNTITGGIKDYKKKILNKKTVFIYDVSYFVEYGINLGYVAPVYSRER